MKKVIIIVIVILVLAAGGFIFYKVQTNNKQENNESQKALEQNSVNKTENTIDNTVENIIENEVENITKTEKEEIAQPSSKPEAKETSNSEPVNEDPFLRDFDSYNPGSSEVKITEAKAKEIAQIGFEESKKRIAGEGADDVASQTIVIDEISPNNYFTRKDREYDKVYSNIKRKAYIVTRTNDMGNGIKIYVDATTGLIIGGKAFGD